MTVSADDATVAQMRNCMSVGNVVAGVVVLAEDLEGPVLESRSLGFFGRDRTRCFSRLPGQMLFACCLAERAPNGHRSLAWPLDSAVGVEAGFTGQFPSAPVVWIMSGHVGLSIPALSIPKISPPRTGADMMQPTCWIARWIGASLLSDR
jgi:hypothetical protein